jgi:hypothetical protein
LNKYINDALSAEQIREWAEATEFRDELDYEAECRELLIEVLYELANPYLTQPLTLERPEALSIPYLSQ